MDPTAALNILQQHARQKHACYNYTLSDGDGDEGVSRAPTFKDRFEAADAKKKRVRQRFVE